MPLDFYPCIAGCNCSGQGSVSPNCSQYGSCSCKKNYEGRKCDFCRLGYYDFPRCIECTCDERGANHKYCDHKGGQCSCKGSYKGLDCNLCQTGYYGFPDCKRCQCNPYGVKPVPGTPLGDCSFSNTVSMQRCGVPCTRRMSLLTEEGRHMVSQRLIKQ